MVTCPAVVLPGLGEAPVIRHVTVDPPGPGEVQVRVLAAGVCRTDLAAVRDARRCPVVLGHEGAGVVQSVGADVLEPRVGEHVVINWQPRCSRCRHCRAGRAELCDDVRGTAAPRVHLDGAPLAVMLHAGTFCPVVVVPARGAVTIRADIAFERAALLGCAVATGLGAALGGPGIKAGDTVVVIGVGGVGLNTVQGAVLREAGTVVAVDRDPAHLALARRLGATDCVDAGRDDPVAAVLDLTGGRGADQVFEVVGDPAVMAQGLAMLGRGGTLTLLGAAGREDELAFRPREFMSRQQSIRGCIYGDVHPERDLPMFADWYAEGRLELDALHTDTISLHQVPELFDADRPSGGIRTVVTMGV